MGLVPKFISDAYEDTIGEAARGIRDGFESIDDIAEDALSDVQDFIDDSTSDISDFLQDFYDDAGDVIEDIPKNIPQIAQVVGGAFSGNPLLIANGVAGIAANEQKEHLINEAKRKKQAEIDKIRGFSGFNDVPEELLTDLAYSGGGSPGGSVKAFVQQPGNNNNNDDILLTLLAVASTFYFFMRG